VPRGGTRRSTSSAAFGRQHARQGVEHARTPLLDRFGLGCGARRSGRGERRGQLVETVGARLEQFLDRIGRAATGLDDVDDLAGARRAGPRRAFGGDGRLGVVVDEERRLLRFERTGGREDARDLDDPAVFLLAALAVPVCDDLCPLDHQHIAGVGPLVDGRDQAVEMVLPELLSFAAVVVDRGGSQGDGRVIRTPLPRSDIGDVGGQREVDGARLPHDRQIEFEVAGGQRRDAVLGGTVEQPVAQPQGRDAVVFVVAGDRVEFRLARGDGAVADELARVGILGHRVGRVRHAAAHARHVERLELLDRVAVRADARALLDERVQVDQHIVAQQVVDRVLPHAVPRREREQVGAFVGGVVVDVHARMLRPTRGDVGEEPLESHPLLGVVVRPERAERRVLFDEAEQVVETPFGAVAVRGLGIERVALEVEEDVPVVGHRQRGQRLRVVHVVGGCVTVVGRDLDARLRPQAGERRPAQAVDVGCHGQIVDRGDTRGVQLAALGEFHARDEQHVAVQLDLLRARCAPAADGVPRVAPRGGRVIRHPFVEHGLKTGAASAVDGQDVPQRMGAGAPVAEDQVDVLADLHAERHHLVAVRGQLQQRGDLGAAGELGVVDLVDPVVAEHDEVGEAEQATVEERRLEQHVGPVAESLSRRGGGLGIVAERRLLELDDLAGEFERFEHTQLVRRSEQPRADEHVVFDVVDALDPAELRVEFAHERPLALSGGGQIARRVHDCRRVDQNHGAPESCPRCERLCQGSAGRRRSPGE
jgi:hypothetical protein